MSPLIYKMIPTQYVFMIDKDGTLNIQQVIDLPKKMKFNSVKEAEEFIKSYDEQL